MFEDIERIIVETEEGEKIATIINDDEIDEAIIVADGYTVRIRPKASQPLREKITYKEAIKMVIEALEKQIPEIPDYEGDGYADGELVYDTWICPRCGRHYEIDYDHYVYCPECGQLIDWSTLE